MPSLRDLLDYGVPIGAAVAGGINANQAAGQATQTLSDAAARSGELIQQGSNQAAGTMGDIYQRQQEALAPYREAGEAQLPNLGANTTFTWVPPDLQNDPIFQRRLEEGERAINARGNAGGIRFSGATMKDFAKYAEGLTHDYLSEDYARAEGTFSQNFNRMKSLADMGQQAAMGEVAAGGQYGANLAQLQQTTAAQLADLEQERANAVAAGDMAKAQSINDMISGVLDTVSNVGLSRTLQGLIPGAPGAVGAASLGAISGGAVPGLAGTFGGSAIGGAALPGTGLASSSLAGAGGTAGAGGGLGASLGAFFTNPITIGVGAALAGALLWKKSQVHPTADTFVQSFQNPFGDALGRVVNEFGRLAGSGQLDPQTAQQILQQTQELIQDFEKKTNEFAAKGSKEKTVAQQARNTMAQYFGPNWENVLGKMQQTAQGLA